MATLHSQVITMDWGTFLDGGSQDTSRVGESYMFLNTNNTRKPLIHFTDDAFHGLIQSGTLSIYLQAAPTASWINVYRVNRAASSAATWNSTGLGPWSSAGCSSTQDRSAVPLIVNTAKLDAGWNHLTINSLSELKLLVDELDMVVFEYTSEIYLSDHYINKANAPYLTINYTTSLLGGVQIF